MPRNSYGFSFDHWFSIFRNHVSQCSSIVGNNVNFAVGHSSFSILWWLSHCLKRSKYGLCQFFRLCRLLIKKCGVSWLCNLWSFLIWRQMRFQGLLDIQTCDVFQFKAISDVTHVYKHSLFLSVVIPITNYSARFKVPDPIFIGA